LRIAIDIGPLRPPFTGVGNFELFLLDALLFEAQTLLIEGFGRLTWRTIDRQFLQETAQHAQKVLRGYEPTPEVCREDEGVVSLIKMWQSVRSVNGFQRVAREARRLGFEFGSDLSRFSLFHAFNYCPPGRANIPVVPVVYDLSYLRYPDAHPPTRLRAMERLGHDIAAAPVVHTISEFTASEITEVFGIQRSRIVVTYPGVPPIFQTRSGAGAAILGRFGLKRGGYALTVSTLEPRKNLRTLVSAFSRLSALERMQMPLCVVGTGGWGDIALPAQSRDLEREGSLRFLGYVCDAELRDLYASSRVMLYPSLYEGFGMPVIEALACGASVVASGTSSLPEAVGSFGRLVHPLDVDAWTTELQRAADAIDYCDEDALSQRRAHALSFTWQRAAEKTIQLYRRVAGTACGPAT
jgi:glycosyltransferase involved in cell wall biosynthesis